MFVERQQRVRVLEALERRAKQFRTDEDLYPLRTPHAPIPLTAVIAQALPDDHRRFDPLSLRQRTLLRLGWEDGSWWEIWVLTLPSGLKLFCDAGGDEPHVLASGGRHASDETDRQFLQLLAESGGQRFGMEMQGGAPSEVRTPIADRTFLADLFVELFEVTGVQDSVRAALEGDGSRGESREPARDFRHDVEEWLGRALE